VYRINKGILDISNDADLNTSTPEHTKRVKFKNMIYLGDGLTDVPCMKLVKESGGHSIAIYKKGGAKKVEELLLKGRVDFMFEANYKKGSPLFVTMQSILSKLAADNRLLNENQRQKDKAGKN
jgi:hypothetical protein